MICHDLVIKKKEKKKRRKTYLTRMFCILPLFRSKFKVSAKSIVPLLLYLVSDQIIVST
jgi:hypothetical protein